jgi:hypothetical protein
MPLFHAMLKVSAAMDDKMKTCPYCGAHSMHDLGDTCPRCGTNLVWELSSNGKMEFRIGGNRNLPKSVLIPSLLVILSGFSYGFFIICGGLYEDYYPFFWLGLLLFAIVGIIFSYKKAPKRLRKILIIFFDGLLIFYNILIFMYTINMIS